MKANWTNRKKILTKKEMKHLTKDAGCNIKAAFQRTIDTHAIWRKENPGTEPCWDCRQIAEKLGMEAKKEETYG